MQPGKGFGTHPHRDMEIVTYVLRGEVEHRDSLGQHGVVAPGGIQYISAGTGVRHSEFNHSQHDDVHFVQMWVLPRGYGETPAYGQQAFDESARRNRWLIVASGEPGVAGAGRAARRRHDAGRQARGRRAASTPSRPAATAFCSSPRARSSPTASGWRRATACASTAPQAIALQGSGELVLWDVPPTDVRLEDA